jgi:hypothetical protein
MPIVSQVCERDVFCDTLTATNSRPRERTRREECQDSGGHFATVGSGVGFGRGGGRPALVLSKRWKLGQVGQLLGTRLRASRAPGRVEGRKGSERSDAA